MNINALLNAPYISEKEYENLLMAALSKGKVNIVPDSGDFFRKKDGSMNIPSIIIFLDILKNEPSTRYPYKIDTSAVLSVDEINSINYELETEMIKEYVKRNTEKESQLWRMMNVVLYNEKDAKNLIILLSRKDKFEDFFTRYAMNRDLLWLA